MRLLRRPRRRLLAAAASIAAVLVLALGGSLLMRVTKSAPTGLPSASLPTVAATPTSTPTFDGLQFPYPGTSVPAGKTKVAWLDLRVHDGSAETAFVDKFNASNRDNIFLQLSIISNSGHTDDDIAAGAFDIVGPIGTDGLSTRPDTWLGLNDEIAKYHTDLGVYPPALLNTFKDSAGQYEGLPYDEYPAFIFYNKDLFAKARLPDLPTKVGEKYMGQDWTWDELATIAKQLTVDVDSGKPSASGSGATIRQYGFDAQWVSDLRRFGTAFGAGSYVASDGKTAQIPAVWQQATQWYYDAMWVSHFAPTNAERTAADMGGPDGTTVATGRVAMDLAWAWTVSSFGPHDADGNPASTPASPFKHWDMGVLPSNNGVTTDPIDTDTFVIHEKSKVPDAAYKAMLAIMADPSLMASYGGMPANPSLQAAYFKSAQTAVDAQFANNPITWPVLTEMAKYAASPAFDAPMPNYNKATADDQAFYTRLQSQRGLNVDAEIAKLKAKLQADFNAP